MKQTIKGALFGTDKTTIKETTTTTTTTTPVTPPATKKVSTYVPPLPPPPPPVVVERYPEPTTLTVQKFPVEVKEVKERPAILHEKIRKEEVEEIQPVIHRERERTEVHQVTQPIYEAETRALSVHESVLPAETKETVRESLTDDFLEQYKVNDKSTSEFTGTERVKIEKPPIIVESEKRRIIEEVQPIIYKEIVEPHVYKTTLPIYEKIVEAPTIIKEILPPRTIGEPKGKFHFHNATNSVSNPTYATYSTPQTSYSYTSSGPSTTTYQSTYMTPEQGYAKKESLFKEGSYKSIPIQELKTEPTWSQKSPQVYENLPNIRTK